MMRTSVSQFEFMVQFMTRNEDINKPSVNGCQSRIRALQKWEELATALNLDATGTTKTVEKWKKVWSDLKNNTKKKAAKIAANGSGAKFLTPLEQQVLKLSRRSGSSTVNDDDVNVDVLEIIEQSAESNGSLESETLEHYETDQLDSSQQEIGQHETVQVEIIDQIKREKHVREETPEFVTVMETSVINETNKLFSKIIEQELLLVPKRRRIECMQEILGVIRKHNS